MLSELEPLVVTTSGTIFTDRESLNRVTQHNLIVVADHTTQRRQVVTREHLPQRRRLMQGGSPRCGPPQTHRGVFAGFLACFLFEKMTDNPLYLKLASSPVWLGSPSICGGPGEASSECRAERRRENRVDLEGTDPAVIRGRQNSPNSISREASDIVGTESLVL